MSGPTSERVEGVRLFWDFFGPAAAQTAAHFHHHLVERLVRDGYDGCEARHGAVSELHAAVSCDTPQVHVERLRSLLRPRRHEPMSFEA